jgi:hypothetical protein
MEFQWSAAGAAAYSGTSGFYGAAASPRIAQLVLCNDLASGVVYAMKLPTAGAEHRFVSVAIG